MMLTETQLEAIEQEIASSLAFAKQRYPDATDDEIHTAVHHRDALALVADVRALRQERDSLQVQLTLCTEGSDGAQERYLSAFDQLRGLRIRLDRLRAERDAIQAENERYRAALEHYADESHWPADRASMIGVGGQSGGGRFHEIQDSYRAYDTPPKIKHGWEVAAKALGRRSLSSLTNEERDALATTGGYDEYLDEHDADEDDAKTRE